MRFSIFSHGASEPGSSPCGIQIEPVQLPGAQQGLAYAVRKRSPAETTQLQPPLDQRVESIEALAQVAGAQGQVDAGVAD